MLLSVRQDRLRVLCWQRAEEPFAGRWALPGGLLAADERLGAALARQLAVKVAVHDIAHLEQLETRSDPDRDPRRRTLATAYLGLVPCDVDPDLPTDTRWHRADRLPSMAFDHRSIVRSAVARLRAKLSYTTIGYALAPEAFTITELRTLYAAALGHDVSPTNLQRVLLRRGVLEQLDATGTPAGGVGRPPTLYRFRERRLVVTNEFAAFRPAGRPSEPRTSAQG